MRRVLAMIVVLVAAGAVVVFGTGAKNDGGGYRVRAIFQNAFSVVAGEDVKIAGVKVGKIESLDVNDEHQAVVVLDITRPGFQDFRKDAECTIRPQGLIGERFVECTPTQAHAVGTAPAPELDRIRDGQPGAGEYLLPVQNTSRPIDIDLVNDIMRLPFRQRLGILINEFGTGLAGRGGDLRAVIRNADPALKSTDKVVNLLASQNRVLANLARDSATSLAPLARDKQHVANFIVKANDVAQATAERRSEFQAQFAKLPAFLSQLKPTMERLSGFSDQATPVLSDLGAVAPQFSRFIKALGPFSSSATVSLKSLGEATIPGRKALVAAKPIVTDLNSFSIVAKPLASNLAALLTSLHDTGGIERLMDYIYYQVAAINGFDSAGHYLRAELILNLCTAYATPATANPACSSNFQKTAATARAAKSSMTAEQALHQPGRSLYLRRMDAVLRGMSPARAIRETGGANAPGSVATTADQEAAAKIDSTIKPTSSSSSASPAAAGPAPASSAGTSAGSAPATTGTSSSGSAQPASQLLDYLLGGGA
jgi:phospholipid/cholesterol/gamma-HCH transport system substrate-binding protein